MIPRRSDPRPRAVIPQGHSPLQGKGFQIATGSSESDAGPLIRQAALDLGFARVGFASAEPFDGARLRFEAWLAAGFHGDMAYLAEKEDRSDPRTILPDVRTIVSVALPYGGMPVALRRSRNAIGSLGVDTGASESSESSESQAPSLAGTVARYAAGSDYHRVLKDKLSALARECETIVGRPVSSRACVDTAPLLEREAAARAGVGFVGKSTLMIAPGLGTYFLLGELLLDVAVSPGLPIAGGCGRCTACLDACPTGAFVGPYLLDARRCISYLTIETKGPMPRDLRPLVGSRVFGCDVCQDVCPFNASETPRPAAPELAPRPALTAPALIPLLELGAAGYRRLVKKSALRRVGKTQLQRNAAVALGNSGDPRAVPPLVRSLESERSSLVRMHAAWALGELGGEIARAALERARTSDGDPEVRDEALTALGRLSRRPGATP